MNSENRSTGSDAAQMTLDSIGDGVLSIDIDGNVTYLNPAAASMTGWSCQAALGRSHLDVLRIIDSESREQAVNPLALAILHNRTATLGANSVLIRRGRRQGDCHRGHRGTHPRCARSPLRCRHCVP